MNIVYIFIACYTIVKNYVNGENGMDLQEDVEKAKGIYGYYKQVKVMVKKYNIATGLYVLVVALFFNTYIGAMHRYVLKAAAGIVALFEGESYDIVIETGIIPEWIQVLSRVIVVCLLLFFIFVEIRTIMQGANKNSRRYRIMGCFIIMVYAAIMFLGITMFRYSGAVIRRYWAYWTVLVLYALYGIFVDQRAKSKKVKNGKKKRKGKKKKK